ncbi:MAG: hypothetical protein R3321_03465 [Nitrososphaeraceae archaeon]|nr:hypothetical protein [Nitrososphaeraceae archaeon]
MSVDLLSEAKGNIPYIKLVGVDVDGSPIMEFIMSGHGKINGDIDFTEMWTIKGKQKSDDILQGEGLGVYMLKDDNRNETVTVKSNTISTLTENGIKHYIGANFYETSSTGKFVFLKNLVGMFKAEVDESGNYITKVWEWK